MACPFGQPIKAQPIKAQVLRIQPYIYQLDKIEKHEKRIQKHRILDGYDRMEEIKIDLKNLR